MVNRFGEATAFHCQQAVEKYLKALLVRHQIEFPKTHDIGRLLDHLALADRPAAESLRYADMLSRFGVEGQYPGDAPELMLGEDVAVVAIAGRVREAVTLALQPYI